MTGSNGGQAFRNHQVFILAYNDWNFGANSTYLVDYSYSEPVAEATTEAQTETETT